MYICGNCKKEMKVLKNKELVCEKCNQKYELSESPNMDMDNQDINIYMDYMGFKNFLKNIN